MMINKNNIEEYIWLSVDNELSIAQQKELHSYLQQDAQAMAQWNAAKETVLLPNADIQLPSKLNLYAIANAQKTPAVIWLGNWKIAATIALLITAGIGLYQYNITGAIDNNTIVKQDNSKQTSPSLDTTPIHSVATTIDSASKTIVIKNDDVLVNKNTNLPTKIIDKQSIKNEKSIKTYKSNVDNDIQVAAIQQIHIADPIINDVDMNTLPAISTKPIEVVYNTNNIGTTIVSMQKVSMPTEINYVKKENIIVNDNLTESKFLNNNKAMQFFKKINYTLVQLNAERKNMKQNGVQLEVDLPNIFTKKQN